MAELEQVQEQEAVAVVTVGSKKKEGKSGDLILDIAHEIEGYSKTKALNRAEDLATDIETNYFRLGGVLNLINDNSWYEGFDSLATFVGEKFGFQYRKAKYLMDIYTALVSKQIPWEKVGHLGWTKLKDLAPVLTQENVDEWVAKAEKLTVLELQAVIKGAKTGEGEVSAKTTTDTQTLKLKGLKPDQMEVAQQALAKAKGELHTEYDNVAAENIFAFYLGNSSQAPGATVNLKEFLSAQNLFEVCTILAELHPEYDVTVDKAAPVEEPTPATV